MSSAYCVPSKVTISHPPRRRAGGRAAGAGCWSGTARRAGRPGASAGRRPGSAGPRRHWPGTTTGPRPGQDGPSVWCRSVAAARAAQPLPTGTRTGLARAGWKSKGSWDGLSTKPSSQRPSMRVEPGVPRADGGRQRGRFGLQQVHAAQQVVGGRQVAHVDPGAVEVAPGGGRDEPAVAVADELPGVVPEQQPVAPRVELGHLLEPGGVGQVEGEHSPVRLGEEAEAGAGPGEVGLPVPDERPPVGVLDQVRVA